MEKYNFTFTWWQDKKQLTTTREVAPAQALAKYDAALKWEQGSKGTGRSVTLWGPGVMRTTLSGDVRKRLVAKLTETRVMVGVVYLANEAHPPVYRLHKIFKAVGGIFQVEVVKLENEQKAWRWLNRETLWRSAGGWFNEQPALVWTGPAGDSDTDWEMLSELDFMIIKNEAVRYDLKEPDSKFHIDVHHPHIRSTRTTSELRAMRSRWAVPDCVELSYLPQSVIEGYGRRRSYAERAAAARAAV